MLANNHRRRARDRGITGGLTGAVTAIQRVGGFANANVHFHTLVPEGVWHEQPDGSLEYHALPPPTDEDVAKIGARIVDKIGRLLARRDGDAVDAEAVQLPMSLAVERMCVRVVTQRTARENTTFSGRSAR